MKEEARHFTTDLAVIGSGIAGCAASIFALNRHIKTAQVGNTGAVAYTTGYLDLLGAMRRITLHHRQSMGGDSAVEKVMPQSSLCLIAAEDIKDGFEQFTAFLGQCGIAYTSPQKENITALTPAGTLKKTLCVPATMAAGPAAFAAKTPCVIVDCHGLKGFSGRQVVANLQDKWPSSFRRSNHLSGYGQR